MSLKFKKASKRTSTLKTIGTVAEFVGKGGYHELSNEKNFKGTMKKNGNLSNVTIKLVNAEEEVEFVNCSAPVSTYLRDSNTESELKNRLAELSSLPILELPQVESDENSPNYGNPVMVIDEETGLEIPLVLYSISFAGGADMSGTRTVITEEMLKAEVAKRAINLADLIAV